MRFHITQLLLCSLLIFSLLSCEENNVTRLQAAYLNGNCHQVMEIGEMNFTSPSEIYYLGLCEKQIGNHELAIAALNNAHLEGFQPREAILLNLASSHAALGQKEMAYDYLNQLTLTGYKNDQLLLRPDFDSLRGESEFVTIANRLRPSFNIWMTVFLFVSLQALFMSVLLFFQKNTFLGILLLCFSIVLFSFTLYWSGYQTKYPYLNNLYHLLPYLAGPLFYFYIRKSVIRTIYSWSDTVHFLPVWVIGVLISPWILSNFTGSNMNYIPQYLLNFAINPYTKILSLSGYLLAAYYVIRSKKDLNSNLRTWLRYLLIGFAGYVLTMLAYYILVRFSFFNPAWDYAISFSLAFFIFLVSFMGYIQPRIVSGETLQEIIQPAKYTKSSLPPAAEQRLVQALQHTMEVQQIFKNGKLHLEDLAQIVNSNRHDISMIINKHFDGNFFEFLNRYRVSYIVEEMSREENADQTLIQLAYEAGFNNKVSFNKAFKKYKGMTPSEFRKQLAVPTVR